MCNKKHCQRHIPLEGTTNLRNLGGYHTIDGSKTTKWGVLYRSDQLADIPADTAQSVLVDELHIHDAYDLRDLSETTQTRVYCIPQLHRHSVPIDMSAMENLLPATVDVREGPAAYALMYAFYRHLVAKEGATIGALVKSLIDGGTSCESASLIHCTAGKDRTGWTVYLILSLLNISEEEKRADYLLTNTYFRLPKEAHAQVGAEALSEESFHAFWTVCDDYLDTAIEEVNELGGVEAYAKSHMGLTDEDIRKLRELLLEPVE